MNTDKNNTQLPQSSVSVSAFLNGKAETDFEPFCVATIRKMDGIGDRFFDHTIMAEFSKFPESFKNALIIDFFDSVGINITIGIDVNNSANSCEDGCENCDSCYDTWNPEYEYCIYIFTEIENNLNDYSTSFSENNFQSRKDALESSIQKANELYNAKVVEAEH